MATVREDKSISPVLVERKRSARVWVSRIRIELGVLYKILLSAKIPSDSLESIHGRSVSKAKS